MSHYGCPYTTQTLLTKMFKVLRSDGVEGMAQVLEKLGIKVDTAHWTT